jgi:uncharacterized protein YcbX
VPVVTERVGAITELHRYPVKSMLGEDLSVAAMEQRGIVGDRMYALVDDETGKVVSAKYPRRWGRIFELIATSNGGVRVQFPDGLELAIDDPVLPDRLSWFFGRRVRIAAMPPADARYDETWERELNGGVDPYLGMTSRMEDGEEVVDAGQFMVAREAFFDFGALHLVTTSTLRTLAELAPSSQFDSARFRPNIVIDTDDHGFPETAWAGRTLAVGEGRLTVSINVPRCVMTTLAQGSLPADREVLRTITAHNAMDIGLGTELPCVGVYAEVDAPATIRVGDTVTFA